MVNTSKTKVKVKVFGSNRSSGKLPVFEIKFDNQPLLNVSSYNYLGITLDHYNLHVKKLISSVSVKLKQLQRMRSFLNIKAASLVYKCMLLPVLEYGDLFLHATSTGKNYRPSKNKGLICSHNKTIETDELHAEIGFLKLRYRREQHLLNFIYDWSCDPSELVTGRDGSVLTRCCTKRLFKLKKPNTEKFKSSFAYKGKTKWNNLPDTFHHSTSKESFKQLVRNWVSHKLIVNQSGEALVEVTCV